MSNQRSAIPDTLRSQWAVPWICLALIAMILTIYAPTLRHGFSNFDDDGYVTENRMVLEGLTEVGICNAFTGFACENWHPLTIISHMVDVQLFGLWAGAHHAVNLFLHALNSVLLFLVLRSMTGAHWRSATVAALFAVHPLHVESVAWIAERKDLLSGLFFLLTLGAYLRYVRRSFVWGGYLMVLLFFAMGLLSKPMVVTLPCLLLLIDWWPLGRWGAVPASRLLLEKLPLLLLAVADCLMTLRAQVTAMSPLDKVPVVTRLCNALLSYQAYLSKMLWPRDLCVFYPLKGGDWQVPVLPVLGSFLLLLLLTAISVFQRIKRPYLLLGWLWYLGMLVPVIGIVQVGGQAFADRYTYLPLIGMFLAGTWLLGEFARKVALRWKLSAALAVLTAFSLTARHQVSYWRDNEILWRHVLACTPEHPLSLSNLAEVLLARGGYQEGIELIRKVVAFNPNDERRHNNLGSVLLKSGDSAGAITEFREALRINPSLAVVHQNLAKALYRVGERSGGIREMREALRLEPRTAPIANDLAWMLATAPEKELRNGREALELARNASGAFGNKDPNTLDTLAAAYAEEGDFPKALEAAREALRLTGVRLRRERGLETRQAEMDLAENLRGEIKLYEEGRPMLEPR
jgi:protein O-mannosyl-transferase